MCETVTDLPVKGVPHTLGRYRLLQRKLGSGNYATVVAAIHLDLEVQVAVKIIDTSHVRDQYVLKHLAREADLLRRLAHPNIIAVFESMRAGPLYCLVTELASGGELCDHVSRQPDGHLDQDTTRRFASQLISALAHMHGHGVVHRDLKMKNILLNHDRDVVKIIDFGLSNVWSADHPLRTNCGSPGYAAPEIYILGKPYGPEVDMWSLGVVLYGMAVGRLPFPTCRDKAVPVTERRKHLLTLISKGATQDHVDAMSHFSELFGDLVSRLLTPDPADRLTVQEATLHPWLEDQRNTTDEIYRLSVREHHLIVCQLALMFNMSATAVEEHCTANRPGEVAAAYNILAHQQLTNKFMSRERQPFSKFLWKLKRTSSAEQDVYQDQYSPHSSSKNVSQSGVDSYRDLERGSNSQDNLKLRFSQLTFETASMIEVPPAVQSGFITKKSSTQSCFQHLGSLSGILPRRSKPVTENVTPSQPSHQCDTIVSVPFCTESLCDKAEQTTAQNGVKIGKRSSFTNGMCTRGRVHRAVQTSSHNLIAPHEKINSSNTKEFQLNKAYTNTRPQNLQSIDNECDKSVTLVQLPESNKSSNFVTDRVPNLHLNQVISNKRRSSLFRKGKSGAYNRAQERVVSTCDEHTFISNSCKEVSSSTAQNKVELVKKLKLVTWKKQSRSLLKSACPLQQSAICSQEMKDVSSSKNLCSNKNGYKKWSQDTPLRKMGPVSHYKMDVALEESLRRTKGMTLMPWRIWARATKK